MVMTEAMKEEIWLQNLLDDSGIDHYILKINCDSISAIYLAKNQVYYVRTKHNDTRFYFVREIFDEGDTKLQKIHTEENLADMLTKVVSGIKFAYWKELLYVFPVA